MTFFFLQPEAEDAPPQAKQAEVGEPGAECARRESGVRIGFTVPKALGGAVQRNRMRRRTREAVRHHLALLQDVEPGVDVVINPKKSLLTAEFSAISQEVERGFGVIRRACASGGAQASKRGGAEQQRRSGPRQSRRSGTSQPAPGEALAQVQDTREEAKRR